MMTPLTTRSVARAVAALVTASALAACATPAPGTAPVVFETATAWVHQGPDSSRLSVEIADTPERQEVGLSGRPSLAPDAGMLFLFGRRRSGDDGFWMWRTLVPLDVAFLDVDGVILRILSMEPCAAAASDDCPGYFPGVAHASALETHRGWFAERGIGEGARVKLVL